GLVCAPEPEGPVMCRRDRRLGADATDHAGGAVANRGGCLVADRQIAAIELHRLRAQPGKGSPQCRHVQRRPYLRRGGRIEMSVWRARMGRIDRSSSSRRAWVDADDGRPVALGFEGAGGSTMPGAARPGSLSNGVRPETADPDGTVDAEVSALGRSDGCGVS